MATEKQIEANRLNAQKSTGPKTDEGKAAARRNAFRHGFSARTLPLPEAFEERVKQQMSKNLPVLRPHDEFETWLAENIARDQVRINDIATRQAMRRCELAQRAQEHWDDDRRADALALFDDLARRPASVAARLQQSTHGCVLMAEYWETLLGGLDAGGPWDDRRREFALDLLGVPHALRTGPTVLDAPAGAEAVPHCRQVAEGEIERLRAARPGRSRSTTTSGGTRRSWGWSTTTRC